MSEPVILELELIAPIVLQAVQNGIAQGKSAYQSYVDTTDDDPILTEQEWADRITVSETDPIFTQWLNDTPPAYPNDIPTDTGDLTNNAGFITIADVPAESDPEFTTWLSTTPPAYPDDIPSITGLLDETAHDQLDHTGLTGIHASGSDAETATSIGNLHLTDIHITRGNYTYHDQSATADTAGDWRTYADANGYYTQYCTVGNATKGSGTWTTKMTIQI